jgi:hypothetical protein
MENEVAMKGSLVPALLAGSVVLASGCGSHPLEVKAVPDPADYATCPSGSGSRITGTTFARSKNGGLVSGSGRSVTLDPSTRYATAVFRTVVDRQNKVSYFGSEKDTGTVMPDAVMLKCRRTAVADEDGKFTFENVPPGSYIVSSYLSWLRPDGKGEWVGSWNVSAIAVQGDGKTLDLVLSGVPETLADPPARRAP